MTRTPLAVIAITVALAACRPPLTASAAGQPSLPRTTAGTLAVENMDAEIASLEKARGEGFLTAGRPHALVDLYLAHGQFLGSIADYERALAYAQQLVADHPRDEAAYLSRAGALATFHRFPEALADLDTARGLGANADKVDGARAAILQATGHYESSIALRQRAAAAHPTLLTLGGLATALGESGDLEGADRTFGAAAAAYRDVSPFPLAWLRFQQGLMWMRAGRLDRARERFEEAHRRLPQYAAAAGHLGEVELALGHVDRAIELLASVAVRVDDPDAAGHLAYALDRAGRRDEAARWRAQAAARYDALMAAHPEAFADHAAEFWLLAGDGPRALALARRNLEVRRTPAAYALLARATAAVGGARQSS